MCFLPFDLKLLIIYAYFKPKIKDFLDYLKKMCYIHDNEMEN